MLANKLPKRKIIKLGQIRLRSRVRVSMALRFGSLSYDDIVHAVHNTTDSCINSPTDRHSYVLVQVYYIQ